MCNTDLAASDPTSTDQSVNETSKQQFNEDPDPKKASERFTEWIDNAVNAADHWKADSEEDEAKLNELRTAVRAAILNL